jgi:diaminopropionate ammonia-lyase
VNDAYALIRKTAAPSTLLESARLADLAWTFHRGLRGYAPTPLRHVDHLAADLGIAQLFLKDESFRFGLNAFKGLGASFAMHHWMAAHDLPAEAVFTTATDGNHGRAVAWMARQIGRRAVVYMPSIAVAARIEAIVNEGAKVVLVEEGYDAAVALAIEAGSTHGWIVIQDTATVEYHEVPGWIGAGYWSSARELEPIVHPADHPAIDVVLVHAGVGTWPAAMTEYYWNRYGERRPRIVVVEPVGAACVLESVQAGRPVRASGSMRTIMAGLNCGFPSLSAFEVLRSGVDAVIAIPDHYAEDAMRRLAGGEPQIVAGESGAASVAGLIAIMGDDRFGAVRDHVGLGPSSRVLVWSTEGATDPAGWHRVVGRPVPSLS